MSKYCPCARHRLPESVSARRRRPRSLVRVSRVSRSPRLAHRAVRLPRLVSLDPLRARLVQLDELFALRHALLLHLGLVIDRFVVVVLHVRPVVASSSSRSSSVVAIDVVASFGASFARARARRSPARVVRPRGAPAVARTSFSRASASPCADATARAIVQGRARDRRRTPRRASRARDQFRARSLERVSRHRFARFRRSNALDGDAARGFVARAGARAMTEVTTRGTPGLRSVRDLPIVQVRRSMRKVFARRGRRAVADARGREGRARARTMAREGGGLGGGRGARDAREAGD